MKSMQSTTMYLAPPNTPMPACVVSNGVFIDPWPSVWRRIGTTGPVDIIASNQNTGHVHFGAVSMPTTTRSVEVSIDVSHLYLHGLLANSVVYALGIEDANNCRLYFSRIRFNSQTRNRNRVVITASVEAPYQMVMAGHVPTLPAAPLPTKPVARPVSAASGAGSLDLVPGRLTGFREWKLFMEEGPRPPRLGSVTAKTIWPWTPKYTAVCHAQSIGHTITRGNHDRNIVPHPDCSCGIYSALKPFHYGAKRVSFGNLMVTGVTEAWGPTELGNYAMRSRYARIVALCADFSPMSVPYEDEVRRIYTAGEVYRVPVFASRAKMLEEFPPSDISALLSEEPYTDLGTATS